MGWFDLLLALLLCTGCVAGADRRHGFWSLFTVVGVSQLVLHFTAGGHQGMVDGPGISLGMVLSHLLAALFISTILTLGERGLWVLLAVLRGPLSRLPVMADLTLSWVRRPTPTVVARPARTLQALVDVLDRRGPPVAVAS